MLDGLLLLMLYLLLQGVNFLNHFFPLGLILLLLDFHLSFDVNQFDVLPFDFLEEVAFALEMGVDGVVVEGLVFPEELFLELQELVDGFVLILGDELQLLQGFAFGIRRG